MYFPASQEQANCMVPQRQGLQPAALLEPLAQQNEHISLVLLVLKPCMLDKSMTVICCSHGYYRYKLMQLLSPVL